MDPISHQILCQHTLIFINKFSNGCILPHSRQRALPSKTLSNFGFFISSQEEKTGQNAAEATVVKLLSQQPFIIKMDPSLAQLAKVEHLGLSTNQIEKISNLNGLYNLKILSLGRNSIKKIEGLDAVADTLEELWISYNQIERLNGIECCKKLRVLYASNNKIKAWEGISSLGTLSNLSDVLLFLNPLEEKCTQDGVWISEMSKRFPLLKKLDGKPIIREDDLSDL